MLFRSDAVVWRVAITGLLVALIAWAPWWYCLLVGAYLGVGYWTTHQCRHAGQVRIQNVQNMDWRMREQELVGHGVPLELRMDHALRDCNAVRAVWGLPPLDPSAAIPDSTCCDDGTWEQQLDAFMADLRTRRNSLREDTS